MREPGAVGIDRPGGFAERLVARADRVHPTGDLPPDLAVLSEPVAVALQALVRADLGPGDDVVVVGAGCIGRVITMAAADQGARVLVADREPARLRLAERLGAARAVCTVREDSARGPPLRFTHGTGPRRGDRCDRRPRHDPVGPRAGGAVAGTVVLSACRTRRCRPGRHLHRKEASTVLGSATVPASSPPLSTWSAATARCWAELVSHRFPLAAAGEALALAADDTAVVSKGDHRATSTHHGRTAGWLSRCGPAISQATLTDGPELRDLRFRGVTILDGVALTVRGADWSTVPGHPVSRSVTSTGDAVRVVQSWRFLVAPGTVVGHLEIELEPRAVSLALRLEVESTVEVNRAGFVLLHPLELVGSAGHAARPLGLAPGSLPGPGEPAPAVPRPARHGLLAGRRADRRHRLRRLPRTRPRTTGTGVTPAGSPTRHPWPSRCRSGCAPATVGSSAYGSACRRIGRPDRRRRTGRRGYGSFPTCRVCSPPSAGGPGRSRRTPGPDRVTDPGFLTVEVLADDGGRHAAAPGRGPGGGAPASAPGDRGRESDRGRGRGPGARPRRRPRSATSARSTRRPHVSDDALVRTAAAALAGTSVAVGAGTRGYLAELGRSAAGFAYAQFVQLSVSAEVHHDDDERIMDTTRALPFVVDSARAAAGGLPLVVAPLTLAQRLSVHEPATDRYAPWDPTVEPDRRAGESFGAAWCLASVAGLIGAEALGYFSVTPVTACSMRRPGPPRRRPCSASWPDTRAEAVRRCEISDPRRVAALALSQGEDVTLYLANLGPGPTTVLVDRSVAVDPVVLRPFAVKRLVSGNAAPHRAARRELSGEE